MGSRQLTKRAIEAAVPGAARHVLWDATLPGFGVRIATTGRKVFVVSYRSADGRKRLPTIGTFGAVTLEQARAIAKATLARVASGEDPSAERQEARAGATVAELAERYLDATAAKKKPLSIEADRLMFRKYILPLLGEPKGREHRPA